MGVVQKYPILRASLHLIFTFCLQPLDSPDKQGKNRGRGKPPKEMQWKPGQSGNPKGRPPNSECLTSLLREAMEQPVPETQLRNLYLKKGARWRDAVVRSLLLQSAKGNTAAIRELLERLDGKVMTPVSGTSGSPVRAQIEVIYGDDSGPDSTNSEVAG